jgi:hypothetical protein
MRALIYRLATGFPAASVALLAKALVPRRIYRFAATIAGLVAFLGMSYLYEYGDRDLYENILRSYGILPFQFPFVDISFSLAAWECARQGVEVILSDPCDVLHRGYSYSPLWITASPIPLGVGDTATVGWCLDVLFIGSLSLLPPPRRSVELVLILAATFSTMVVFAVERANLDIVMFVLALAAGLLAECRTSVRFIGYCLALVAALLKYYPIMVLIIVFRERLAIFGALGLIIAGALVVFWAKYHVDIARGMPGIPSGPYNTDLFAAKNLPLMVSVVVESFAEPSPLAAQVGSIITGGIYAALVVACINHCRHLLRFAELRAALASQPCLERVLLVIGSAVIAGCFFAGQSVGYRGVFFLLVMPGLLTISRSSSRDVRNLGLRASVVIVLLMWGECFRLGIDRGLEHAGGSESLIGEVKFFFWLIRELGWWWTVSIMLTVLTDFILDSPITRWLSSRTGHSVMRVR